MSTITKSPKVGDIVAFDNATKRKAYFRLADYDGVPEGYTIVGIVAQRQGNNILVAHKTSANQKWADIYDYEVTGFTLDGASHDVQIRLHGKPTTSTYYTFTYAAETKAAFATAFNDWLQASDANGGDADRRMYVCYVDDDDRVILRRENYATAEYPGSSMTYVGSGLTLTYLLGTEVPALAATDHFNGATSGDGGIINMNRALLYFKNDNSSASYNPTAEVTTTKRAYAVCLPAYLGQSSYRKDGDTQLDYCSYLRRVYGQGEAGWRKQMNDRILYTPSQRMAQGGQFRNAKKFSQALGGVIYTTMLGTPTVKPKYPAAAYAQAVGYAGVEGMEQGDWFLGSIDDIAAVWKDQTYPAKYGTGAIQINVPITEADPINRGLNVIGGTLLGNNLNAWSSIRCSTNYAYIYYGSGGYCNYGSFYGSYRALPLSLITLEP